MFDFYKPTISIIEKKIGILFPDSEISALTLYSAVEMYGYAIIKNTQRQRIKNGADSKVYIDYGDKIQEEKDLAQEEIFSKEELNEMKSDYSEEEVTRMMENEIGIRVTYRLLRRYFGKTDKEVYNNLDKIQFVEYQL
jgi:hypothetical protein